VSPRSAITLLEDLTNERSGSVPRSMLHTDRCVRLSVFTDRRLVQGSSRTDPIQEERTACSLFITVELSATREPISCGATWQFPTILRNPKVYYRIHNSSLLFSMLSQTNPAHTIPSSLYKIHLNVIYPHIACSS
jgi:hypothetical protein